jgi:hypothetical protein
MPERNKNANIIKELKYHVIILENKLNDIGYHYFLLTNDEFELDIEFIKTFFKNNNNCNNSAKWIVFIILLLKRKIKYYENLNKKKKYYLITKVMTFIILIIIHIFVLSVLLTLELPYWLTLETIFETLDTI